MKRGVRSQEPEWGGAGLAGNASWKINCRLGQSARGLGALQDAKRGGEDGQRRDAAKIRTAADGQREIQFRGRTGDWKLEISEGAEVWTGCRHADLTVIKSKYGNDCIHHFRDDDGNEFNGTGGFGVAGHLWHARGEYSASAVGRRAAGEYGGDTV